jgi:hypothetical protein
MRISHEPGAAELSITVEKRRGCGTPKAVTVSKDDVSAAGFADNARVALWITGSPGGWLTHTTSG